MLSYAKSGTARTGDQMNGFKKGKTQQFNSGGVVKWAYFQKKSLLSVWITSLDCPFNKAAFGSHPSCLRAIPDTGSFKAALFIQWCL